MRGQNQRRKLLLCAGLCVAILVLLGASVRLYFWYAAEAKKQEFVERYEVLMREDIQTYYFVDERLPTDVRDVLEVSSRLRSADIWTELDRHRLVRPQDISISEFERATFAKVVKSCNPLIPSWQAEIAAARKPLMELDGDLPAQLNLYVDPTFDTAAGYKFLGDLAQTHDIEDATMKEFITAFYTLRNAKVNRERMKVDIRKDARANVINEFLRKGAEEASQQFEEAKQAIIDRVSAHETQ